MLATAGLSLVTGAFNVLLLPRLAQACDVAAQRRIMGETLRYVSLLLSIGTAVLLEVSPGRCRSCLATSTPARPASASCSSAPALPFALRQVIVHGLCCTGDWRPRILAEGLALGAFAASFGRSRTCSACSASRSPCWSPTSSRSPTCWPSWAIAWQLRLARVLGPERRDPQARLVPWLRVSAPNVCPGGARPWLICVSSSPRSAPDMAYAVPAILDEAGLL